MNKLIIIIILAYCMQGCCYKSLQQQDLSHKNFYPKLKQTNKKAKQSNLAKYEAILYYTDSIKDLKEITFFDFFYIGENDYVGVLTDGVTIFSYKFNRTKKKFRNLNIHKFDTTKYMFDNQMLVILDAIKNNTLEELKRTKGKNFLQMSDTCLIVFTYWDGKNKKYIVDSIPQFE
jgi:hypothetical protein